MIFCHCYCCRHHHFRPEWALFHKVGLSWPDYICKRDRIVSWMEILSPVVVTQDCRGGVASKMQEENLNRLRYVLRFRSGFSAIEHSHTTRVTYMATAGRERSGTWRSNGMREVNSCAVGGVQVYAKRWPGYLTALLRFSRRETNWCGMLAMLSLLRRSGICGFALFLPLLFLNIGAMIWHASSGVGGGGAANVDDGRRRFWLVCVGGIIVNGSWFEFVGGASGLVFMFGFLFCVFARRIAEAVWAFRGTCRGLGHSRFFPL